MSNKKIRLSDDDVRILNELSTSYRAAGITRENGHRLVKDGCWAQNADGEMVSNDLLKDENGKSYFMGKDGHKYVMPDFTKEQQFTPGL